MHKPSRPEDLEHHDRMWARAITFALLDASYWELACFFDDDGLEYRHSDGWWWLTPLDGGRALFVGGASGGSGTYVGGQRFDILEGCPDWLPRELLREQADRDGIGFLYWWEEGAWHRIPYPEELREDGLAVAAPWLGSEAMFNVHALRLVDWEDLSQEQEEELNAECARFRELAERRAVDEAAVTALLAAAWPEGTQGMEPERVPACLDLAARAGIIGVPARR